jgi:hypothetical protein
MWTKADDVTRARKFKLLDSAYRHPFEFVSPKCYIEAGSSLEHEVKHTSAYDPYIHEYAFFFDDEQEWNSI